MAALDASLRLRSRRLGGELFDQHQQGEVFWIGEEETAQAADHRAHVAVGVDLIEPLRDRSLGQAPDDGAFPTLLRLTIGIDPRLRAVDDRLPGPLTFHWTAVDLTSAFVAHERKSLSQNRAHGQTVLVGEPPDIFLLVVNEVATGLCMLAFGKAIANRQHSSADAVSRFHDRHACPVLPETNGGGESGESGTDDENGCAAKTHALSLLSSLRVCQSLVP
jgi:hypothetical protein